MEADQEQIDGPKLAGGGDIGEKFNVAKEKKAQGDEAFKNSDLATGGYPPPS